MRPLRAVLFDLDGTLIDHFGTIHQCIGLAARAAGLREPSLEEVRRAVGGGIATTLRTLFGEAAGAKLEGPYLEIWERDLMSGLEVLPGASATLARLHGAGLRLAIFTNKFGGSSRRIAESLGWSAQLAAVIGVGDTPWRKPQPEFSRHALELLGCGADEALLVGDSPYDAQAARCVGMRFWGVTTGTHDAAALRAAGAARIFEGMEEVSQACLELDRVAAA